MSFGNAKQWMIEIDKAQPIVNRALDLGINFFDTANMYSNGHSEEIMGELLKGYRDEVVLATKVYFPMGEKPNEHGLSRVHIMKQIDASLKRLQTDHVDLYQIHRWDYETPIEETLRTLNHLIDLGKTRYIGASSMWAWQFAKALYTSEMRGYSRFVSMQNLYNLLYREEEREMIPLCKAEGIALVPWSPTAGGFLSGKYLKDGKLATSEMDNGRVTPGTIGYNRYVGIPQNDTIVGRVLEISQKRGVTPNQVAISWLLRKGVTSPIIGTSNIQHLEEMVESLDVTISEEEAKYLEEPYAPKAVSGHI
jgi:aryl-alcohol dehydrogenase (NADP+)